MIWKFRSAATKPTAWMKPSWKARTGVGKATAKGLDALAGHGFDLRGRLSAPIESSNPNPRYNEWLDMVAMGSEYDPTGADEMRRTGRVADVPLANEGRRHTGLPFECGVQRDRSFR